MRWWWGIHCGDAVARGLAVTRSALLRTIWGVGSALSVLGPECALLGAVCRTASFLLETKTAALRLQPPLPPST